MDGKAELTDVQKLKEQGQLTANYRPKPVI
jgi:hypothetical protein